MSAFRHRLTGQMIVMPGEDIDAYQAICERAINEPKPKGLLEEIAVPTTADFNWRLNRATAAAIRRDEHRKTTSNQA